MIERCLLASSEISELDVINTATVTDAVSRIDRMSVSRLIVTDQNGVVLVNDEQLDLSVLFYGADVFLYLRFGVNTNVALRPFQIGQGHLYDIHAVTSSRKRRAPGIFSAAAVTTEGSML